MTNPAGQETPKPASKDAERRTLRRVRFVLVLGIVAGLSAIGIDAWQFGGRIRPTLGLSVFLYLVVIAYYVDERKRRIEGAKLRATLEDARKAAQQPQPDVLTVLPAEIAVAMARARLNMATAERRADRLYAVGVALMVMSVFAPIGSGWVYVQVDPLPPQVIERVQALRSASGGSLPTGITISVQRDWRLLVAGISFGFLFLAAARGVLAQHERQTRIYYVLASQVTEFENLSSVLRIEQKASELGLGQPGDIRRLADVVIERLQRPVAPVATDVAESDTSTQSSLRRILKKP